MTSAALHQRRSSFLALLALATLALAGSGGALFVKAELESSRAAAEEAACRAREEGLAELSCMNFSGLDRFFLTLWGACLLAAGAGTGLALAWLASRPDARHVRLTATIAAVVASGLAGAMLVGSALWSPVVIVASGMGALAAALGLSLIVPPRWSIMGRSTP